MLLIYVLLRSSSGGGGKGVLCSDMSLTEMELRFQQDPKVGGVDRWPTIPSPGVHLNHLPCYLLVHLHPLTTFRFT